MIAVTLDLFTSGQALRSKGGAALETDIRKVKGGMDVSEGV